jgi:crotonobetainyl-CoA:carnitine CoA-transferase CaiB-like acyl-CoA transferase
LGQHSQEIVASLGYPEEEIQTLFQRGVIADRYRAST